MYIKNRALRLKIRSISASQSRNATLKSDQQPAAHKLLPYALVLSCCTQLFLGVSTASAAYLRDGAKNIAGGTWPQAEKRNAIQDNTLGVDLAYITRYQPYGNTNDEDWRVQTIYNTRYQPGYHHSALADASNPAKWYGGHLNILGQDNHITDLTQYVPGYDSYYTDVSDLDISYDGNKILFSVRHSKDEVWRLCEVTLNKANYAGSSFRYLTPETYDCIDPCYTPGGKIIFTANSSGTLNEYEMQLNELLHVMDPNPASGAPSNTIRQLSFFPSGDYNPMIMNDGRLLWMRYEHHGPQDYFPLMASRPDGTFVEEMFGFKGKGENLPDNPFSARVFFEFTQLPAPDNRIISTAMWHFFTWEAGALVEVDPRKGPTDFTPPHNLTPDIPLCAHGSPVGRFRTPYAYKDGEDTVILASYSHGPVTVNNNYKKNATFSYKGGSQYKDFKLDSISWVNNLTPDFGIWQLGWVDDEKTELEPVKEIVNTSRQADIDPRPIMAREEPPQIPSYYDENETSGEFLCLNVNDNSLIGRAFDADPKGGWQFKEQKCRIGGKDVSVKIDNWWEYKNPEGTYFTNLVVAAEPYAKIVSVRVLESLPVYVMGNTHRRSAHYFHEPKRIIDEVPVEKDGSFRIRIPVKKAVHFQTLDANGRVISSMQSWVYLNPTHKKMQTRVCIGCHEKRGHTVPNGAGLAVAATKEAHDLRGNFPSVFTDSRMYNFVHDIYPIIREHCLPCHDNKDSSGKYKTPAGHIDLSDDESPLYTVAYDSLRPWMKTDNALRRSELLRMFIRARKVRNCGLPQAPPDDYDAVELGWGDGGILNTRDGSNTDSLTKYEWDKLATWMEMGALFRYYGDGQVQSPLPGKSESEYENGVTDVLATQGCSARQDSVNRGCHADGKYGVSQYYLDLDPNAIFTDMGGGPCVVGETAMNMSNPDFSRILKAPTDNDSKKTLSDQCVTSWKNGYPNELRNVIRNAQNTFVGSTVDTSASDAAKKSMIDETCNTSCHETESVTANIYSIRGTKNVTEWKRTIMKMVMYVHRYGLYPEDREQSKLEPMSKGWSVRASEAALVLKLLKNYPADISAGGKSATTLYNEARNLRYPAQPDHKNYVQPSDADIIAAQQRLWAALKASGLNDGLEKRIRIELGVLFTQYLDDDTENYLFETMKDSRPKIPQAYY